mgnify:FL=1
MAKRHIVIVGGGFSGTALAIHLARYSRAGLDVTLIEPRPSPGRGVAYGSIDPSHRINVPAARMYLSAAEEGEFDRWFRASPAFHDDPQALWHDGSVYPQRSQFGAWVGEQFSKASQASSASIRFVQSKAVALQQGEVVTADGRHFPVDDLVLAISHPPPALPSLLKPFRLSPALIADPWQANALAGVKPDDRVAIIGSGLTMSDVVASLHRQGHRGNIVAFSRRGLLPRPNLSGSFPTLTLDYDRSQPATARGWLRRIRQEVAAAGQQQLPWQLILDDIRRNGQNIWQQLPLAEQQRFLRYLRPWWDVHRYRIAPQINAVLEQWQTSGQLQVIAAHLTAVTADEQTLTLALRPRGTAEQHMTVDKLIVTTGPAHGSLLSSDELLSQLAHDGVICADPLGLGIQVNQQSQAVNVRGETSARVYVAGPAARARFGELMGLPQVADHAEALARYLLTTQAPPDTERCRKLPPAG